MSPLFFLMNRRKFFDIVGTILLGVGFFFGFLPHVVHVTVGLDTGTHLKHVISGMVLVIAALGILVYNNKALKIWNKR